MSKDIVYEIADRVDGRFCELINVIKHEAADDDSGVLLRVLEHVGYFRAHVERDIQDISTTVEEQDVDED